DRRPSERMDRLHRLRRRAILLALEPFELVVEAKLFHQPHDALGARRREVVDRDHRCTRFGKGGRSQSIAYLSCFANISRSVSIVSASCGFLSGRYPLTRAKRSASPPG